MILNAVHHGSPLSQRMYQLFAELQGKFHGGNVVSILSSGGSGGTSRSAARTEEMLTTALWRWRRGIAPYLHKQPICNDRGRKPEVMVNTKQLDCPVVKEATSFFLQKEAGGYPEQLLCCLRWCL